MVRSVITTLNATCPFPTREQWIAIWTEAMGECIMMVATGLLEEWVLTHLMAAGMRAEKIRAIWAVMTVEDMREWSLVATTSIPTSS